VKRKVAVFTSFLGLMAGTASPQAVKDVRSVLEASLKAMGGDNLKTIQYSASGWSSRIGQTYGLAEDWPFSAHYRVPFACACRLFGISPSVRRTISDGFTFSTVASLRTHRIVGLCVPRSIRLTWGRSRLLPGNGPV
jgi:hypothetical protein